MRLATATDHALLLHWRKHGDPAAFAKLVDRHAAMVHSASMRVVRNRALAQEVAQETFLKLTQLDKFEGASLGGWLHRVAANRALDVAKSESRRHARDVAYESERGVAPSSEVVAILHEIDDAIAALPDELREPIVLHYLEGRTHKEIAQHTKLSRPTITRRIHDGLELLRTKLGGQGTSALLIAALAAANAGAAPEALIASLRKLGLRPSMPMPVSAPLLSPTTIVAAGAVALLLFLAAILVPRLVGANSSSATNSDAVSPVAASPATVSPAPTPAPVVGPPPPAPIQVAAQIDEVVPAALEQPESSTVLRCVDGNDNPVADAEVYFVRHDVSYFRSKPGDIRKQVFGPFESDSAGRITAPAMEVIPDSTDIYYQAYARVPGKLVGAWHLNPGFPRRDDWNVITLMPSRALVGRVTVPKGFQPQSVTVRLLTIRLRSTPPQRGGSFSNASKLEEQTVPPLAAQRPDAQGRFQFNDLPADGAYYLAVNAPGLAEAQQFNYEKMPDGEVALEMHPESQLFGTIRYSPSGAPAANVPVFAHPHGGPTSSIGVISPFITHTDAIGRFRFTGLPAEIYDVMAPPQTDWVSAVQPGIRVERAEQFGPVDLTYEYGGFAEGFVRNSDKEPIGNVMLVAMNPDGEDLFRQQIGFVTTDETGYYRFRLPTGRSFIYIARVPVAYKHPESDNKRHITIAANQSQSAKNDFILAVADTDKYVDPGTATIVGRVVNAAKQPLADVPIYDRAVTGSLSRDQTTGLIGQTDHEGKYRIAIPAIGTHTIMLGGRSGWGGANEYRFSRVEVQQVSPKKDETYDLGERIVEEYTEIISGAIVDEAGNPVGRVMVGLQADHIPGFEGTEEIVDESGHFAFKYVPKGHYTLWVSTRVLIRSEAEGPSPYVDTTQLEVDSGFEYQVIIKRKDALEAPQN